MPPSVYASNCLEIWPLNVPNKTPEGVKGADYDKSPWTEALAAADYRATNYGN